MLFSHSELESGSVGTLAPGRGPLLGLSLRFGGLAVLLVDGRPPRLAAHLDEPHDLRPLRRGQVDLVQVGGERRALEHDGAVARDVGVPRAARADQRGRAAFSVEEVQRALPEPVRGDEQRPAGAEPRGAVGEAARRAGAARLRAVRDVDGPRLAVRLRAAEEHDARAVGREARLQVVAHLRLRRRQHALGPRREVAQHEPRRELRPHGADVDQRAAVGRDVEAWLRPPRAVDEHLPRARREILGDDRAIAGRRAPEVRDPRAALQEHRREVRVRRGAQRPPRRRTDGGDHDRRACAVRDGVGDLRAVGREPRREFQRDVGGERLGARELPREALRQRLGGRRAELPRQPDAEQQHERDRRGPRDDAAARSRRGGRRDARRRRRHWRDRGRGRRRDRWRNGRRNARHDRRHQPVADLRQRLDEARLARVVAERGPQVGDRPREHLVVDRTARPDLVEQHLPRYRRAVGGREPQQHVHQARLDPNDRSPDGDLVRCGAHLDVVQPERGPLAPRGGGRRCQHFTMQIKALAAGNRNGEKREAKFRTRGGPAAQPAPHFHPTPGDSP